MIKFFVEFLHLCVFEKYKYSRPKKLKKVQIKKLVKVNEFFDAGHFIFFREVKLLDLMVMGNILTKV